MYKRVVGEGRRIYRLDSKNEKEKIKRNKMKKKRMEKWGWKCVQPRTIATVSTVLSFRGWWRFARHRQVAKKSVATSIYPTSRRRLPPPPPPPTPFATLVYTARSNPRLTINLVTSLLGSSRLVARTSLLGCHPGVYHSVKPEIDNNKCLVKLWRRMVNREGGGVAIRSRIRGVFHGNNGGNEAGNRENSGKNGRIRKG